MISGGTCFMESTMTSQMGRSSSTTGGSEIELVACSASRKNHMIGDHGGFSHDDTNVILLVSHPSFTPQTVSVTTRTAQMAPTILYALGLDPKSLDAVVAEGTRALTEVGEELGH
jgi:hypothetical protein